MEMPDCRPFTRYGKPPRELGPPTARLPIWRSSMSFPGSDTSRAIVDGDMEDAALNGPDGAEQVPRAFTAARNGDSAPVLKGAEHVDREADARTRQAPPVPPMVG